MMPVICMLLWLGGVAMLVRLAGWSPSVGVALAMIAASVVLSVYIQLVAEEAKS